MRKEGGRKEGECEISESFCMHYTCELPRRPCKLGLALASIDPLLECVFVCLYVGTYTYMYVLRIWGMYVPMRTT